MPGALVEQSPGEPKLYNCHPYDSILQAAFDNARNYAVRPLKNP
jgi:hypothetical protein